MVLEDGLRPKAFQDLSWYTLTPENMTMVVDLECLKTFTLPGPGSVEARDGTAGWQDLVAWRPVGPRSDTVLCLEEGAFFVGPQGPKADAMIVCISL